MFKKQGRRTDMATELRELYHETHPGEIDGIECLEEQSGGVTITAIRVLNETGSQKL